jgi:hypothetical protein
VIEFLVANWLWIVFVIAMVAMHRHGGHDHGRSERPTERPDAARREP